MSAWTSDELERVAAADELELTLPGRTVTIWVVRVGDDLYVRSHQGRNGHWFRRARTTGRGRISSGGVARDVELIETDTATDAIDSAYRIKYQRYGARYVDPIIAPPARAATLRLEPRNH